MFARQYTEQLLEMIEDGILDRDHVINCMTSYMSEDDVKDMMITNELVPFDPDDEDEAIEDMFEIDDDNALEEEFI
jgi:hypothetical protein